MGIIGDVGDSSFQDIVPEDELKTDEVYGRDFKCTEEEEKI